LEQKKRLRYTDEEARRRIIMVLGGISIPQVKGLPKPDRDELLRKVKKVKGISQRQAARILGVSPNLVFKA
jgi:putative transposase